MQTVKQDQLEELSLTLDKMNVVAADVSDYLQNSSGALLQYYLEENRLKAAIVMDYAWQAKEEVDKIRNGLERGQKGPYKN